MERLRLMAGHHTILIMAGLLGLALVWLLASGQAWALAWVPLGVLAQMGNEYALHRFAFHMRPPRRQWAFDLLYQAHYGHHDFPTCRGLFFVPVWVALPMLAGNTLILWAALSLVGLGTALPVAVSVVCVGGVATFLGYEWFHMTAHLPIAKTAVERHVTTLHNQHHFRDFSKWFHVSPGGEVIDRIMGTAIDREALKGAQRIEFIRTLGMRPDDARLMRARARFAPRLGLSAEDIKRAAKGA